MTPPGPLAEPYIGLLCAYLRALCASALKPPAPELP